MGKVNVRVSRPELVLHFFDLTNDWCVRMGREVEKYVVEHDLDTEIDKQGVFGLISVGVSSILACSKGYRLGLHNVGLGEIGCDLDELEKQCNELAFQSFMIGCGDYGDAIADMILESFDCDFEILHSFSSKWGAYVPQA